MFKRFAEGRKFDTCLYNAEPGWHSCSFPASHQAVVQSGADGFCSPRLSRGPQPHSDATGGKDVQAILRPDLSYRRARFTPTFHEFLQL